MCILWHVRTLTFNVCKFQSLLFLFFFFSSEERISDLLAENDRLKKENECFLEIFRTLNIQPNGLLEMNHQLKNVAKRDNEKLAQNLLSPTQTFNQNMSVMISPPGQPCDPVPPISQFTGSSLLSPTIVNGNLVLPQTTDGFTLGNGCMDKKDSEVAAKNELDSQQADDMEQVLQEIMEATNTTPSLMKQEEEDLSTDGGGDIKNSVNNPASVTLTSSSQAFVNVSTHQPSVTANEAQPKLTSAATTPATMVTQSLSGPITTTAGSGIVTTAGQPVMLGQPTTSVSSGMRVSVPPVTTVSASQPNLMFQQQQGQTLLLSLPGRPGLIPVKIAPPVQKSSQPVLLPNQGQCGSLARQLNTSTQKRRPLKIKEQGKDSTGQRPAASTVTLQPQVLQSGPTGQQTMTVRLPVGANQQSGNVMWNSGQMVMQQTLQQPVVINTPGGGQQTVLMPLHFQQPVVQQPQQMVYIQQNGQLIPVVVNPPQQQVVSNPVIVNSVQQQSQPIQVQAATSSQTTISTISTNSTPFTQPSTSVESTTQGEGQTLQQFMPSQDSESTNVSSSLQSSLSSSSQASKVPTVNRNETIGSVPRETLNIDRDCLPNMKQSLTSNNQHHFDTGLGFDGKLRGVDQHEDNADPNDILAQAAEHIFTTGGGGDAVQQVEGHLGMDSSSAQEENNSHSKRKKKKKKKEKEKDKERGKESKKKSKKVKKRNHEEDMQVEMSVPKDNNFSASNNQALFERLLQETEQTTLENDAVSGRVRPEEETSSTHVPVDVSQGEFLPEYPLRPPIPQDGGDKLVSEANMVNSVSSISQDQAGDTNDILSNSMNFIGLPTLAEESDQQSQERGPESEKEEQTGRLNFAPMHSNEQAKVQMEGSELTAINNGGQGDDDDDTEAHAFSPAESFDPETEVGKQSPFEEVPIPSSESVIPKSNLDGHAGYPADRQSDYQKEKTPPPAYPTAVNKSVNKGSSGKPSPAAAVEGRDSSQVFDILSQPWLTQSTAASSQSLGNVASVLPQRTNTSDHSQNQNIMSYGNVSGYPRHSESQVFDSAISSSHSVPQPPPVNLSNLYKPVGTTEPQLSRPNFNFYSSAPSQKSASEAPAKGPVETVPFEPLGVSVSSAGVLPTAGRNFIPQASGGTPMRALEKPPPNKSFTKANIHRTLTSFDKLESEKEEKWAREKEKAKLVKDVPKPPQKKPEVVIEGEEDGDLVGHRALDKELVNKFPWLADEEEEKAAKDNMGKTQRNPTPFNVQSMAQSSAQSYKRKRQEKTTGAAGGKEAKVGKTNPQQGDGGPWNLWNPSFSKANEKPRNDPSLEEVTIIRELKEPLSEKPQTTSRAPKSIPLTDQTLSGLAEFSQKGKRKAPQTVPAPPQQNLVKSTTDLGGGKDTNQPVQSTLESALTSSLQTLPAYPNTQAHHIQVSEALSTPFSQYNATIFSSDTSQASTKPFVTKASLQSPFSKVSPMDSNAPALTAAQERDQSSAGDIFQSPDSLDFFFDKDQSDLSENMVDSLQPEQTPALGKQSSMQTMRGSPFEQVPVSSPYGQQSHMSANLNRQLSQVTQRISTPQTSTRPASQPSSMGVKRPSNQLAMQPGHPKRHQKDSDLFRGSPMSDRNHMGSPETATGPYGSPMMPTADQQSSGPGERPFRYQQGVQGFSGHPNVSGMQPAYTLPRGEQVPPKKSKTMLGPDRNPEIGDVGQSWSNQGVSPMSQGSSRSNARHPDRTSQPTTFISDMPSPSVPSGFSQNDVSSNPGNGGLISSLSPTRHLRPNELPTYLPSLPVRNPILTSPPYPGKGNSTREPEISFESMFTSSRSNSLPLNVPHNYSVFPDHPAHNSGLSTVKHGHVSHVGNSTGHFNFSNIFNDVPVSSSQGHANPSSSLNHTLHPAMHLGNPLQSPADEALTRGGVNQRHRNQQLGNTAMRLDHLFSQNPSVEGRGNFPMGVATMGVPTHPFVPGMPPY